MPKKMITSPYLPGWEYVPDGEPHVFGDRLYIFGSHDAFNGKAFCMNDYVGWSAPLSDLSDWRYEGYTFRKTQDPDNRDGKNQLWAPDVARGADGRYYLYYCLANYPKIGVAVCDSPAGQYEFLGYVHDPQGGILGQRPGDIWPFDPGVLVDDDGRVHLYAGQSPRNAQQAKRQAKSHKFTCHMELEPDMITLKAEPTPLIPSVMNSAGTGFEGHEFFEASSIRKFDGKYYFIYSSRLCHELCWAVSDRPDGGFTYGGTLISNGDIGLEGSLEIDFGGKADPRVKNYLGNNHGSVEKIGENYYIFYHRPTNRHMSSRQACVARIEFKDGAFKQAEMTSCGLADELPARGVYEARIACQLHAKEGAMFSVHPLLQNKKHPAFTQDTPDGLSGTQYIENMRDGATAVFKYLAAGDASRIKLTLRGKGKGEMKIFSDEGLAATVPFDGAKEWTVYEAPYTPAKGRSALRFTYEGKGAADFLQFELL